MRPSIHLKSATSRVALVTDEMQRALPLDVPIVVGLGAAPNWLDAH